MRQINRLRKFFLFIMIVVSVGLLFVVIQSLRFTSTIPVSGNISTSTSESTEVSETNSVTFDSETLKVTETMQSNIVIRGSVTDLEATVDVYVNGNLVPKMYDVNDNKEFRIRLDLEPGVNEIALEAHDSNGEVSIAKHTIRYTDFNTIFIVFGGILAIAIILVTAVMELKSGIISNRVYNLLNSKK